MPLNGLRHPVVGDASGWFIWRGKDLSSASDYFQPMHVAHLVVECPEAAEFLALPPGWRFLIAPGYVDVWYDETLCTSNSLCAARRRVCTANAGGARANTLRWPSGTSKTTTGRERRRVAVVG